MEDASLSRPSTLLGPLSKRAEWWPLTARQSLIWADQQLLAQTRYHHWVLWIRFDGLIDLERFQQAWEDTVKAHDALSLIVDARAPRQRFAIGLPGLRIVDLPEDISVEHWVGEQSTREFTPARQPWDAVLVRGANDELAFVFHAHYQVCDERSFHIIALEVNARYERNLVATTGSFRQILLGEAAPDGTERSATDRDAWKQLFAEQPPPAVPLGCVRASDDPSVARESRWLSGRAGNLFQDLSSSAALLSVSRESSDDLWLAAIAFAWLHVLSGQRDLVVSISLDRRDESTQRTVGLLSDLFYLRTAIAVGETFSSLMEKVRDAYQFARQHSNVSLGDPGCASAFVGGLPNWPSTFCGNPACYQLGNAAVYTRVGLGQCDGRNDLAIRQIADNQSLGLVFDFNRATYPEAVRDRLVGYFINLFHAFLEDPRKRIESVDWLPSSELEYLRHLGTGREPSLAPDLLTRFSEWVALTPAKTAIEFHGASLTYRELDGLSNRLARRLLSLGVRRDSAVAVAMPRGFGELTALLATLKAQGAYVPVDPSHPVDRVKVILEDASPEVLVAPTNSSLAAALSPGVRFCALDDVRIDNQGFDDHPMDDLEVGNDQLAYVLFTSGSTGRPKGVEIPRSAFANFLQSMETEPGLSSSDRVLGITTTTFDIAGLELFLPLYVGATIVLADKDTAADPLQLRGLVERSDISLIQATPATWRLLLDAGWSGRDRLRMLCGGEAMSLALANRLLASGAELWNVYGPTETTVWSTLERLMPGVERVTIGHPIDHTQVTLRHASGQLVALGAIGEICIAGRGLACGYRSRPELTTKAFCFDPMTGARYYRTGDLGRYLPDGRLECLGRLDHQIKVRGFRIEPSDIEAQLRAVPGVQEVLVLAQVCGGGDPQLVAYWVGTASRERVIQAARASLPPYMVPSAYVQLDAFPLTTSGKIDRKQLPSADAPTIRSEREAIAPRNDQESVIASMFREILGLPFVPVDEDFFALGGTSVRAVQLRSRIADVLGVTLPLRALFEQPTVEGIVAQLDECPNPDDPVVAWTNQGAARLPWIGVMGIQLFEDIARALPRDQPFLGIHIPTRYVPGIDPFPSVVELARKYVTEVKEHQPNGPYFLVGLCHGGIVAFEMAVQLEALGEQVGAVALLDAELPSARRVSRGAQLKSFVKELVGDPQRASQHAMVALGKAMQLTQSSQARERQVSFHGEPVDMPFDGPEIDQELATYQSLEHRTQAQVLTFRATKSDHPPWITIDRDLGWSGRSQLLTNYDVAASHLGIVRQQAAVQVAEFLDAAKKQLGL